MEDDGQGELYTLLATRDRKDTRVFAHATAETQIAITDTYAASRPVSRAANIAINTQEPGFLEVFPRVASRPPKLLQELEALLVDRLRSNDKAATTAVLLTKDRDTRMASNLALDAQRQVFSAFTQGFTTYTHLLSKVQADFAETLDEGLRSAFENVELRVKLNEEEQLRRRAEADIRSKIMAEEVEYRRDAFAQLQEMKERTARLVKRAQLAEKELHESRAEEARMQGQVRNLQESNSKLRALLKHEANWAILPTSATLSAMKVGALTKEDETFLEQEYTSSIPSSGLTGGGSTGPSYGADASGHGDAQGGHEADYD